MQPPQDDDTSDLLAPVPELKGGRLALAESTSTAELPRPSRSED
ncbi:hypothetical protein [Streptomyces sp. NPDC058092]